MKRVLMVISAADRWTLKDGTVHPSGYWGRRGRRALPHLLRGEMGHHRRNSWGQRPTSTPRQRPNRQSLRCVDSAHISG